MADAARGRWQGRDAVERHPRRTLDDADGGRRRYQHHGERLYRCRERPTRRAGLVLVPDAPRLPDNSQAPGRVRNLASKATTSSRVASNIPRTQGFRPTKRNTKRSVLNVSTTQRRPMVRLRASWRRPARPAAPVSHPVVSRMKLLEAPFVIPPKVTMHRPPSTGRPFALSPQRSGRSKADSHAPPRRPTESSSEQLRAAELLARLAVRILRTKRDDHG